ncbi:hypothetical protein [Pedobacter alluvionis]|uniref:hypothetical protein n=1 Tax=Pedobacter alluvionis TaxID=475253 RepID=UPI00141BB7A1|nr:hypothetical protein [Pedobacter alluvionis]
MILNIEPFPTSLSTLIVPPAKITIAFTQVKVVVLEAFSAGMQDKCFKFFIGL